jgi:putative ATP-binding cassette transporter
LENLTVQTPDYHKTLVQNISLALETGQGLLIMGDSGCGKSSLLRAIAGLWNSGTGVIIRPELAQMLFLPQRPYMILGTLREQLLYPNSNADVSDKELYQVLKQVNLPDLAQRFDGLDAEKDWSDILSLGEQQRLAFARLLVAKPKYAILDEATSALDVKNEEHLYSLLIETGTTFISVGHRPTLKKYHQLILEL